MEKRKKRFIVIDFLVAIASIFFSCCFAFSAVSGESGLFYYIELEAELVEVETQLANKKEKLAILQNKTRRLSDDYLDLDLLDTQARAILGLMRADEIILD